MSKQKDLLILVWVHGFKGNEVTFESFPDRISHLLSTTHPSLQVESHVFPAYQTRGELRTATLAFVDWLTTLTVTLESEYGMAGGKGKAKIVLLGHSMGGLLIVDAALDIASNTRQRDPLWPHIVGVLAFDTPYLGLHPHIFKNQLSQAANHMETARNVASSLTVLSPMALGLGFGKFGKKDDSADKEAKNGETPKNEEKAAGWGNRAWYGAGALALGAAAAGTAYFGRDKFASGWKWGYDHMTFVRNLWDEEGLKKRLQSINDAGNQHNVVFRNYYTNLPPSPPDHVTARTFIIPPPKRHALHSQFVIASNSLSKDEVSAHMGMFDPKTNDGFYDLGLAVVRVIGKTVEAEGVTKVQEPEKEDML